MIRPFALAVCLALPNLASAQDQEVVIAVGRAVPAEGGALLRGLDRISGKTVDFGILPGETVRYERLDVTLGSCRYPKGQAQVEAFAYVTIKDIRDEDSAFEGWMFASSPALSSLDHPRYDVWVLSCRT